MVKEDLFGVRAYHKRAIYIKDTGSSVFKEAYFILNDIQGRSDISEDDIISEANRIVEQEVKRIRKDPIFGTKRERINFALGFFLSLVITLAVYLIALKF